MSNIEIKVPKIVIGGNVFGWSIDEATSFAILDAAVAGGLNTFDTADIYSYWGSGNKGGESETIIGKWLKKTGKRNEVVIHTKGGAPGAPGEFANGNATAAYLTKAVEASLKRLQIEAIDLYYVHYDDNVTPPEETLTAFQKLIAQGKIKAIAASNYSAERLAQMQDTAAAKGLPAFSGLQTLYNLYEREPFESELLPLCQKRDIKVLTYFSLAHGFLSGKYRSAADSSKSAARGGGMANYLTPRGFRILDALAVVAEAHKATSAQVALAWLVTRPTVAAAIASATNQNQLSDLVAAAKLKLTSDELAALDKASRPRD
ncbi:aldo/keto reductase [Aestuariivirga litoralis]|uniref:aldo/keto reductase n=1 Tax=Aestuariivirga litoralis TaxID=2650924 RepID=UPI0018C57E8E|nr:aldo/keto reductase [Aestuariivirga litoralis]